MVHVAVRFRSKNYCRGWEGGGIVLQMALRQLSSAGSGTYTEEWGTCRTFLGGRRGGGGVRRSAREAGSQGHNKINAAPHHLKAEVRQQNN